MNPTKHTTTAWTAASRPNAIPYPASRSPLAIGSDISRSSVPLVRSRSIAIDVIRNMMMNGNSPHIGAPIAWKVWGRFS